MKHFHQYCATRGGSPHQLLMPYLMKYGVNNERLVHAALDSVFSAGMGGTRKRSLFDMVEPIRIDPIADPNPLYRLPPELISIILKYADADPEKIIQMAGLNRAWFAAMTSNTIWEPIVRKKFPRVHAMLQGVSARNAFYEFFKRLFPQSQPEEDPPTFMASKRDALYYNFYMERSLYDTFEDFVFQKDAVFTTTFQTEFRILCIRFATFINLLNYKDKLYYFYIFIQHSRYVEELRLSIGSEKIMHRFLARPFARLTTLLCYFEFDANHSLKYLVNSENFPKLVDLNIQFNSIDNKSLALLADSKISLNLTKLKLYFNKIDSAGAAALANTGNFPKLIQLNLNGNYIGDQGVRSLANSTILSNLTELHLRFNDISDNGVTALAESKYVSNLTTLDLSGNGFGDMGAKLLAGSESLLNLTKLELEATDIGDMGVESIAESKTLSNLTALGLAENYIGDEGAKSLAKSKTLSNLTDLDVSGNDIRDDGTKSLVESEALSNLTTLTLVNNENNYVGTLTRGERTIYFSTSMLDRSDNGVAVAATSNDALFSKLTAMIFGCNL